MTAHKVFGIVLAGGEGKRLMPLTEDRAKPAVPFAGHYRLIDFAISNLINSGLRQIVVLTQYKSHSLDRHVSQTWRLSGMLNAYVASVPAQQRLGKRWFAGSADAIFQSLNLIGDEKPDYVVVVGADHVYRMDFQQMLDAHIESGASVTVAGIRQPKAHSDQFGIIQVDPSHPHRISGFVEKPREVEGLKDSPDEVLASMGNYVFTTSALVEAVRSDARDVESSHDMGGDVIPAFVEEGKAFVYDLNRNEVPGARPDDRFYWRDVGTIDAFYEAHQDLVSKDPVFNLFNNDWPIFSQQWNSPPAKFVQDKDGNAGSLSESTVSLGCYVVGAHVSRSVLGPWVKIDSGAKVEDSIVFERVVIGQGARVHRAILDKEVVVKPGATIGVDPVLDRARGFTISESGVTVVAKGVVVEA
ncbi:MAG: glucose-1-phosphate adenylyltransferase [Microbacteriaceae bacterium]|nr:glucose-1-phosphate adenylyltransferase [Microbacteriaceae bacterium]